MHSLVLHHAPERARVGRTQPASNPFEDFQRVFSKFASAEVVTGAAPSEDEEAAAEEEEKPIKEEVGCQVVDLDWGGHWKGGRRRYRGFAAEEYEGPPTWQDPLHRCISRTLHGGFVGRDRWRACDLRIVLFCNTGL